MMYSCVPRSFADSTNNILAWIYAMPIVIGSKWKNIQLECFKLVFSPRILCWKFSS